MTMTVAEREMLHRYMGAARRYLEFGSGESTLHALSVPGIERIDSVESSPVFVAERLMSREEVRQAVSSGRLHFQLVNIGCTGEWGRPLDTRERHLWPNYPLSIFARPGDQDLALVDGRFRVASILSVLLNTPRSTRILVHDFWNRPWYHGVLDFLDVEARADTLAVLRKRENDDREAVQLMLERFLYQPE